MTRAEPAAGTTPQPIAAEAARPPWTPTALRGRQALLAALAALLEPAGARLVVRGPLGMGKASLLAAWQQGFAQNRPLLWLDAQQHCWLDSLRSLAAQTGWRDDARPDAEAMLQHVAQWLVGREGTLVVRHQEVASRPSWRVAPLLMGLAPGLRLALLTEEAPPDCLWPVLDVPALGAAQVRDWNSVQALGVDDLSAEWLQPQVLRLVAAAQRVVAATEGEPARAELQRLVQRPIKDGEPPLQAIVHFALDRMGSAAHTLALCLTAIGGDAEDLANAPWIGVALTESLRDLAEWGWLSAHPAAPDRLCLAPAIQRYLRHTADFAAVQGAADRAVARAVVRHFDRRAQRQRIAAGTAPLYLLVLGACERGAVALAASVVDLAAELLVEAGMADALCDLAQAVLDAAPPGAPAANLASYALALGWRARGELDLADAQLVEALRTVAAGRSLPRHAPQCVSRFAAPRPQTATLDEWLDAAPPNPVLPPGPPTAIGLHESDTLLLGWLEAQSPRADRQLLAARLRGDHAKTLRLLRQPISAWRAMTTALPVLRTLPRHDDRARWLAEAALCQASVGEWSQAAALLQESAAAWRACEQFLAEAETLGRLAAWREYSGELDEARALRETAQALRDRHGQVGDPQDLRDHAARATTAADALLEAGRPEDARTYLGEAIQTWRKLGVKDSDPPLRQLLERLASLTE